MVSSGVIKLKAFQSNGVKKTRASPSTHTCLDCFTSFSSRLNLVKHKLSCKKTFVGPPYTCKYCNASLSKKEMLAGHVHRNCAVRKEKERNTLRNCGTSASKEKSNPDEHTNVAAGVDNEDDDHHVAVVGHEDPDETRDDHVSCEECVKIFTQEDFIRHREETGHTGEIIKLPKDICI